MKGDCKYPIKQRSEQNANRTIARIDQNSQCAMEDIALRLKKTRDESMKRREGKRDR